MADQVSCEPFCVFRLLPTKRAENEEYFRSLLSTQTYLNVCEHIPAIEEHFNAGLHLRKYHTLIPNRVKSTVFFFDDPSPPVCPMGFVTGYERRLVKVKLSRC